MYANRFGLTEDPFRVTPDRRFLFFGDVHGPVISKLRSAMVRPHGLCLLTGAAGVGKTLSLLQVVGMLPEDTPVSLLYNAHLDFRGFLNAVLNDFGVDPRQDAEPTELLEEFNSFVGQCRASGRRPVVIVDEAGNLSEEVVCCLNELTKVHSDDNQGVAVVLGSDLAHRDALVSQLGADLALTEITVDRLDHHEVVKYVEHRMRAAGWRDGATFYESAVERIAEVSGGVPRIINTLAGKALFLTHLGGAQIVSRASVDEAARDLWSVANATPAVAEGSSELALGLEQRKPSPDPGDGSASSQNREQAAEVAAVSADPPLSPSLVREPTASRQGSGVGAASTVNTAPRGRRFAFLVAFALAAATFAAKMSTESGQHEVIETAEPVIENVGRMATGIRNLVAASGSKVEARITHVDWAPPQRPVQVLTRSARYASLQEPVGQGGAAAPAMPVVNGSALPLANPLATHSKSFGTLEVIETGMPPASPSDQQRRISQLMKTAADQLASRNDTEPAGANARETYTQVLAIDSTHEGARRGLRAIAMKPKLK